MKCAATVCCVTDCTGVAALKGLCRRHYQQRYWAQWYQRNRADISEHNKLMRRAKQQA